MVWWCGCWGLTTLGSYTLLTIWDFPFYAPLTQLGRALQLKGHLRFGKSNRFVKTLQESKVHRSRWHLGLGGCVWPCVMRTGVPIRTLCHLWCCHPTEQQPEHQGMCHPHFSPAGGIYQNMLGLGPCSAPKMWQNRITAKFWATD